MKTSKIETDKKSLMERIFHAVMFEMIATAICAPVGAILLGKPILQMGMLSLLLATTAMIWNMIYNAFFDSYWPAGRVSRTFKVRIIHALGFEGGFIIIGVAMAATVLNITLSNAFLLEVGFFLFFLPYTVIYNWVYDSLRERIMMPSID